MSEVRRQANSFTLDAFAKSDKISSQKDGFLSMEMSYHSPACKIGHNGENLHKLSKEKFNQSN